MPKNPKLIAAFVGPTGAGKSTVLELLKEMGHPTYDFAVALLSVTRHFRVRQQVIQFVGESVYDADGMYDPTAAQIALFGKVNLAQAFNAYLRSELRVHFAEWVHAQRSEVVFCELHNPTTEDLRSYAISHVFCVQAESELRYSRARDQIEMLMRRHHIEASQAKALLGVDRQIDPEIDVYGHIPNGSSLEDLRGSLVSMLRLLRL